MVYPKLTDSMSWEEIVEKIMQESKSTNPSFKKWLLSKKNTGGFFFNSLLYSRLFNIQKAVTEKNADHFIVICGKEGTGKSTLAIQIAAMLDPDFKVGKICFKMSDYIQQLNYCKKGDAYILDEGNMFLFSRESYSDDNRFMIKLFSILRQKNLYTIICVPNLFTLDSYVRDHRVDTLIYVHSRSKYVCYVKKAIRVISKEGSRSKSVGGHKVPGGTFFPGYFNKFFPKINNITEETYQAYKGKHFDGFLQELSKIVKLRDSKSPFMSLKEAQKIIPLNRETFIKLIKAKKLRGKMIAGKYFVERGHLEAVDNWAEEGGELLS